MCIRAALALGKIGGGPEDHEAVPRLCELLENRERDVYLQAGHALRRIGPGAAKAVPTLRKIFREHDDIQLRALAARALGAIGLPAAKDAIPDLVAALKGSEVVRPFAAQALWLIEHRPAAVVAAVLCDALLSNDARLRAFAADSLGDMGPEARPAYLLLNDVRGDLNERAAQAISNGLARIGEPTGSKEDLDCLRAALRGDSQRYRLGAARVLGMLGSDALPALDELIDALARGNDNTLRIAAAEALRNLGPEARKAIPRLKEALATTENVGLRTAAAKALGSIGSAAADAVQDLLPALDSDDSVLRTTAAAALGDIGPAAGTAVKSLLKALTDPRADVQMRMTAACALGGIGPGADEAKETLADKVNDKTEDPKVRVFAAYALCTITNGKGWSTAKPVFLDALENPTDSDLRITAARVLGGLGSMAKEPQVIQALEKRVKDPSERLEVQEMAKTSEAQINAAKNDR